jgi:Chaperone of endosialidase
MRHVVACVSVAVMHLSAATALYAQQPSGSTANSVPRVMHVSGVFVPANGQPPQSIESVTIAIYAQEKEGTPLWEETQQVAVDSNGRYTILLGATRPEGLPQDLFANGEARWLGRRFERNGEKQQPRVLLASVPYSLKASDADTLGGRPASAFLLAESGENSGKGTSAGDAVTAPTASADGTTGYIGKFVSPSVLGDSVIYETGAKIGLNTAAPADALDVRFINTTGSMTGLAVRNLGSTAASYSGMLFYDQNGALGQFQGFNNSTHEYRINNIAAGGSINFMLGGSSKFLVSPTGTIGIGGVTNPTATLEVNGGIKTNSEFIPLGTVNHGLEWVDGTGTIQAHLFRWGFSNSNLYITNNGGGDLTGVFLAPGATSLTSTSDERLKTDIEPVTGILDKIKRIRVVSFNMASLGVDATGRKAVVNPKISPRTMRDGAVIKQQIGSIAQDWVADFPELVVEPHGDDGYYALAYDRIGVVALGGVKELNDRMARLIAEKDDEIRALNARLAALEQMLLKEQPEKQPQQKQQ